ncbi:MAG: GntR family transcriptional regulator [Myxococcales bacterium]|nr:MAG: GntR family transcriptional regulator [Myxococcales bacterium]
MEERMSAFQVDTASKLPIVHQVARALRLQISRGRLRVGDYLPSVREMGNELGINFNTVAKAYRLLERQGLVEIRHGLGARIVAEQIQEGGNKQNLLGELETVICNLTLTGASQEEVVDFFAEAIGLHYGEGGKTES